MKSYLMETGCPCGRSHTAAVDEVVVGSGVIARIPEFIEKYGAKKPFLLGSLIVVPPLNLRKTKTHGELLLLVCRFRI